MKHVNWDPSREAILFIIGLFLLTTVVFLPQGIRKLGFLLDFGENPSYQDVTTRFQLKDSLPPGPVILTAYPTPTYYRKTLVDWTSPGLYEYHSYYYGLVSEQIAKEGPIDNQFNAALFHFRETESNITSNVVQPLDFTIPFQVKGIIGYHAEPAPKEVQKWFSRAYGVDNPNIQFIDEIAELPTWFGWCLGYIPALIASLAGTILVIRWIWLVRR